MSLIGTATRALTFDIGAKSDDNRDRDRQRQTVGQTRTDSRNQKCGSEPEVVFLCSAQWQRRSRLLWQKQHNLYEKKMRLRCKSLTRAKELKLTNSDSQMRLVRAVSRGSGLRQIRNHFTIRVLELSWAWAINVFNADSGWRRLRVFWSRDLSKAD